MDRCDIAIVGAGPYGLSAAAHLQQLQGLEVRLIGEPMSFWERHMPEGMHLRSPWAGSHIADPANRFTLDAYRTLAGNQHLRDPLPVKDFIRYGEWFYQEAALPADTRQVTRIGLATGGYEIAFARGESLHARRVVVAAGIQPFAFRPKIFAGRPVSLVTHTSEQRDFAQFRGKHVLVLGAGQSAFEAAVFAHEAGARVELVFRRSSMYWLEHRRWMRTPAFRWMFYGAGEIGQAGASLIIQRPDLFRQLPRWIQQRWAARALRPAVAAWLKSRAASVPRRTECFVVQAREEGERLRVRFSDGSERVVHHVILGTGYRVNVALYPFLPREVHERIELVDGYPKLDAGFESSLRGLHFLGAPAAWSFGPLMRFVAGTNFTAAALHRHLAETKQRRVAVRPAAAGIEFEPRPLQTRASKPN